MSVLLPLMSMKCSDFQAAVSDRSPSQLWILAELLLRCIKRHPRSLLVWRPISRWGHCNYPDDYSHLAILCSSPQRPSSFSGYYKQRIDLILSLPCRPNTIPLHPNRKVEVDVPSQDNLGPSHGSLYGHLPSSGSKRCPRLLEPEVRDHWFHPCLVVALQHDIDHRRVLDPCCQHSRFLSVRKEKGISVVATAIHSNLQDCRQHFWCRRR